MASSLSCFFDKCAVFDAQVFVTGQGGAEFNDGCAKTRSSAADERCVKIARINGYGSGASHWNQPVFLVPQAI
ncbi:MAG: hypothetical protein ABI476_04700 [Oxalobacteraceae bacterium]